MQEVTIDRLEKMSQPAPKKQSAPKKEKKGISRELLKLMSEIRDEYYAFVEAYPEYEFPLPRLNDEKDILALHEQLEHQKKIQRFEYAVRDLPINYSYAVYGISGLGKQYAEEIKQDQQLLDRWDRFERILQNSFDDLNPLLVETLKLYPTLQRQKPHVLLRLAFSIKFLWDMSAETSEPVVIPENF